MKNKYFFNQVWLIACLLVFMLFGSVVQINALGPIDDAVVAWLSLTETQRNLPDQSFEKKFPKDFANRKMYLQSAMKFYMNPPTVGPKRESFLDLAVRLSAESTSDILTLDIVTSMLNAADGQMMSEPMSEENIAAMVPSSRHAAVRLLGVITERDSTSVNTQMKAARILEDNNEREAALNLLYKRIDAVAEPERRSMRLEILSLCKALKRAPEFSTKKMKDPLLIADILLFDAKFTDASKNNMSILNDANSPIECKLSAWAGMIDSDPASAFKKAPELLSLIEKSDERLRPRFVNWFGRELWRVSMYEVPDPYKKKYALEFPRVEISTVNGWQDSLVESMETLLRIDSVACFKLDNNMFPNSLRYPAAVFYGMKGDMVKSREITNRQQEYVIAGRGGEMKLVTPTKEEITNIDQWVSQIMRSFYKGNPPAMAPAPLRVAEAQKLVNEIKNEADTKIVSAKIKLLAEIVAESVNILDPLPRVLRLNMPPPPTREVDMTRFAPIAQAIRDVIQIESAKKSTYPLLRDGLLASMLVASNPQLLESLYQLSTEVIDVYGDAWEKPIYKNSAASNFVNYLSARRVYDMSLYINRLNEKYNLKK